MIDAFVDALDLGGLGLRRRGTGSNGKARASIPRFWLKLYIYGDSRTGCSRAADWSVKAGRNLEVLWLPGRLIPDHKTMNVQVAAETENHLIITHAS